MIEQVSIEVTKVTKKYGYTHALRDVTLRAVNGEVIGLLGPNGSGKTTLLKVLATLTLPTSGEVRVNGMKVEENIRDIRKIMGYLAHESLLYRDLTGEENIRFYSKFYQSLYNVSFQERLKKTFDILKITRWQHEPMKNLSSGLRKRFDLARTIIHDPMIMLLDEPFSSLDMDSVNILHDFIQRIREKKVIVLSTHDVEQAKHICNRIAILVKGKLCQIIDNQDITDAIVKKVIERGTPIER